MNGLAGSDVGLAAVTAVLVTYAFEARSRWFVLAFAISCWLGSAYGFLQGAWPFGVLEAIWGFVARRRWWLGVSAKICPKPERPLSPGARPIGKDGNRLYKISSK